MPPEIGRKYGPYEILGRLGGGGMGYVFRAWDARLHREVAIKLLHNEYAMPGMRERFLREARAASALNHPHICTIFDIGEQNGDPYLVMELLEGQTLRDRIHGSTLPVEDLVCIAREVAEALGAAHAKGVVHRDIKPANIFLIPKPNKGTQAKVLDFGLAKMETRLETRASRALDLTAVGATVGTLAYMSPEQARGESLDSRSDLFSLGVVMYEMATRRIPFQGATSALVFVQLLNHPPEPVRSWNEAVPRDLERIILKLMAKERTARFQTANELEEALARLSDKNAGWLRKAVATVPLVRTSDPIARDRRLARRLDSEIDAARDSAPRYPSLRPAETPALPPANPSTTPTSGSEVLRPVARVPSSDRATPPRGQRAEFVATSFGARAAAQPSGAGLAVAQDSRSRAHAAAPSRSLILRDSAVDEPANPPAELFAEEPAPANPEAAKPARPIRLLLALAAALTLLAAVALLRSGPLRPPLLAAQDSLVLADLENRTGNPVLDGTVGTGLQLALEQSPYLVLRSADSFELALRALASEAGPSAGQPLAQRAALRTGAKNYLLGTIFGKSPPYRIHVDLRQTASNELLTSAEQELAGPDALPAALDRLALTLRRAVGEGEPSIRGASTPFTLEATANLQALSLLDQANRALAARQPSTALRLYQESAALDPNFIAAQLRLASLYRTQNAEVASAEAARLALAAARNASERTQTFAQYEYEMDTTGDFARAVAGMRSYLTGKPHDAVALEALSKALGLEGRETESLQTAQQAYQENPSRSEAYRQAESALLALDRFEAAEQVDAQAQKLGIESSGLSWTTLYLEGRQKRSLGAIQTAGTPSRASWNYGLYLDNIGQLTTGSELWTDRAQASTQTPGLGSAAAFLLAQGALDRALLGDCKEALALAHQAAEHPQGLTTLFHAGFADATCGDTGHAEQIVAQLQENFPRSFAVRGFYLANLKAALALHDNNPAAALEILKSARQFDLISLTPLLRGQAHVMLHQVQIGIVDFQTVLAHRGLPFVVGSVVYPVAQIGLARAFAEIGDTGNSAQAYRTFLELWQSADPNQSLLIEARKQTHSSPEAAKRETPRTR